MGVPNVEVLVLNKSEVEKLISAQDAIDAAETAFSAEGVKGNLVQPPNTHLLIDPSSNNKLLLAMASYVKPINVAGIKWMNAYFGGQKPGIPSIWGGIIVLNDPETGIPFAILDATAITHMRTAGGHAVVGAKYLAKKNSKTMAIVGCGAEGRAGLLGFRQIFALERVKIFDIRPEAMTAYIHEMSSQVSTEIVPSASPEEAFQDADIILMVTSAHQPVLMEEMVPEGSFVAGLFLFQDVDFELSRKADKWVLGNRVNDGNIKFPDSSFSYDYVYADMGEIVTGAKKGRENDRERILYTHMGMGAHDIVLGYKAYVEALKRGVGTRVKII